MATSLTGWGVCWAVLSFASAALSCTAFYLPYWLHGSLFNSTDVYFGSFRRCNYPRLTPLGTVVVVRECGRYTTFADIPSVSWQVSTVAVGVGGALALLVGFTALMACCMTDIVNKATARTAGFVQLVAALLVSVGLVIFPNGWHTREVKEACGGTSDAFVLGSCRLSWSFFLLVVSVICLLICVGLSFKASRVKSGSYRI